MKSRSLQVLIKLGSNTGWLFFERCLSIAMSVGVGLYFARYLGPGQYGVFNYAVGLCLIFSTISRLGINALVVNETVETEARHRLILGSAFAMRVAASLICIPLFNLLSYVLGDDGVTRQIVFICSLTLLFGPLETVTHWFEAATQMRPLAVMRSVITIMIGATKLWLILTGASLVWFAWLVPFEGMLTAAFFLIAYHRHGFKVWDWRTDVSTIQKFVREGSPLLFSAVAAILYMKIDQAMLLKMVSADDAGIYAAAVRISELFYFIPVAMSSILFPSLIRFAKRGDAQFQQAFQLMCDAFSWIALIIAAGTTIFSKQIIGLAFGQAYMAAAGILVIHSWSGVFIFIETLRSKWFVIRQATRFQLISTTSGAVINVVLNFYLIPRYQGVGAAIATTISYSIAVVFSCFLSRQTWLIGTILWKSVLAPLRIVESVRSWSEVRKTIDETNQA